MPVDFAHVLSALAASHERLAAAAAGLEPGGEERQSYDSEWTIAAVVSHLGSGAELFGGMLEAGVTGEPGPGRETFPAVWDRWNAKSPSDQTRDGVDQDGALVDYLRSLSPDQVAHWSQEVFGRDYDLAEFLLLRQGESAVHTWDVIVVDGPSATVSADAVALLVDSLGMVVTRSGTLPASTRVRVSTTDPDRDLLLTAGSDKAELRPAADGADPGQSDGDSSATATLRLPAEAFLRLVYGRLNPDHTPDGITAEGTRSRPAAEGFPRLLRPRRSRSQPLVRPAPRRRIPTHKRRGPRSDRRQGVTGR